MKWANFTLFKLLVPLLVGIVFGRAGWLPWPLSLWVLLLVILLLVIVGYWANKQLFQRVYFGCLAYACFFLIGFVLYPIHQPYNHPLHYLKSIPTTDSIWVQVQIRSVLRSDRYNEKYLAHCVALNGERLSGKILLQVARDSSMSVLDVDEQLLFKGRLEEIHSPKNPYGFDYAAYMRNQGVYHQIRIQQPELMARKTGRKTWLGRAHNFRTKITQKLEENGFSSDNIAIINALLLGQQQDISSEIYQNYAAAGVVHILSVSGLHVGILMLLLQFVFSWMDTRFKKGREIKMVIIILLLWGFAMIAGLSPPVLRSVTMFSFIVIALHLKRRTSTFSGLAASAVVLLVFNPSILFNIGFQLSYLAVWGILLIHPMLTPLYKPKTWVDKSAWGNITVSSSAQLGVLPLTLYYFNQFPGLYLLSNLIIIPFTGLLLGGGILVIGLALLDLLPQGIADGYQYIILTLNKLVAWIAQRESFLFDQIPFSFSQMWVGYVVLWYLIVFLIRKSYVSLLRWLLAVLFFQGVVFYDTIQKERSSQWVVFHKSRNSIWGIRSGSNLVLYSDLEEATLKSFAFYKDFVTHERIRNVGFQPHKSGEFVWKGYRIWLLDSTLTQPIGAPPDVLVLTQNPTLNLDRLTDSIQPQYILADGSNYKSYVHRWQETARQKKIPFHYTAEQGFFRLDLNAITPEKY